MSQPLEVADMPVPFGVSADTGRPLDGIDLAALEDFRERGHNAGVAREHLAAKAESVEAHFGTVGDVDSNQLDQAGWAVMFAPGADQKIRDALQPLLDRRKQQVADERLFKIFEGSTAYQPGDTAAAWLARQGVRMDVVDPLLGVPFYLLIVAAPEEIPFEFQYGLDLYWGVGRVWFPTAGDFRQYASSVVLYETMPVPAASRQMAVFATRHDFDQATQLFSEQVAEPMAGGSVGARQKFAIRPFIGDPAMPSSRCWPPSTTATALRR